MVLDSTPSRMLCAVLRKPPAPSPLRSAPSFPGRQPRQCQPLPLRLAHPPGTMYKGPLQLHLQPRRPESGGREGRRAEGRRGEGRGGEGRVRPTPSLSSRCFLLLRLGGRSSQAAAGGTLSWALHPGRSGWERACAVGVVGREGAHAQGGGVPRHRTEAEVGPRVPRQWEWKVSHGHLPMCTGGRVHPCTREA